MAKRRSDKLPSLHQSKDPAPASAAESDADPYPLVGIRGKTPAEARAIVQRSQEFIAQLKKRRKELEEPIRRQIIELKKRWEESQKAAQHAENPEERTKLLEEADRLQAEIDGKWEEVEENLEEEFRPAEGHSLTASQADLVKLGFPSDCWMPTELAEKWQGDSWPREPSAEAVRQLQAQMKENADWQGACGRRETSQRIRAELEGNLGLLRKYDPRLVLPVGAKPEKASDPVQPATPGPAAGGDVGTGARPDDPTAYQPASTFLDEQFPTFKAIRKALRANPSIRRKRPIGKNGRPIRNRLFIHAGDWQHFKRQGPAVDPLDQPASLVDAVMETEKRKAEIRRQKGEPGN